MHYTQILANAVTFLAHVLLLGILLVIGVVMWSTRETDYTPDRIDVRSRFRNRDPNWWRPSA